MKPLVVKFENLAGGNEMTIVPGSSSLIHIENGSSICIINDEIFLTIFDNEWTDNLFVMVGLEKIKLVSCEAEYISYDTNSVYADERLIAFARDMFDLIHVKSHFAECARIADAAVIIHIE